MIWILNAFAHFSEGKRTTLLQGNIHTLSKSADLPNPLRNMVKLTHYVIRYELQYLLVFVYQREIQYSENQLLSVHTTVRRKFYQLKISQQYLKYPKRHPWKMQSNEIAEEAKSSVKTKQRDTNEIMFMVNDAQRYRDGGQW